MLLPASRSCLGDCVHAVEMDLESSEKGRRKEFGLAAGRWAVGRVEGRMSEAARGGCD